MSFSSACKDELIRIRVKTPKLRLAQLSGMTLSAGGIRISRTASIFYHTENVNVAKHIAAIATGLYELDAIVEEKRAEHRRTPYYEVVLSGGQTQALLNDTGALTQSDFGWKWMNVPAFIKEDDEAARAFLRGCFLGSGSCTDPKRAYHLELVFRTEAVSDAALELLLGFRLAAKKSVRNGDRYLVYLKEGDDVSGMLALIGANVAAMKLENVRVEKDMRNYINRTSNCETANLDKQVVASIRQRAAIAAIDRHYGIRSLPASLQEAALLRIANPEASLADMARLSCPAVTKSTLNYRLKKIMDFSLDE